MAKLFLYLIFTLLIILFATQNLDPVPVYVITGRPLAVPLIAIVGISFFLGFMTAIFGVIVKAARGGGRRTGTSLMDPRRGL
nr:conserved uncharacterized protein [uncultured bacterium]